MNLRKMGLMQSREVPMHVLDSFSVDGIGTLPTDSNTKAAHIWIAVCDLSRSICNTTRQVTAQSLANHIQSKSNPYFWSTAHLNTYILTTPSIINPS
jgi:hypothetical protein